MAEERTFDGVTEAVWQALKQSTRDEFGTVYDPPGDDCGTAVTRTPIGDIVIRFVYEPDKERLTYRIERKPFFVSSRQIWEGTQDRIDACRANEARGPGGPEDDPPASR